MCITIFSILIVLQISSRFYQSPHLYSSYYKHIMILWNVRRKVNLVNFCDVSKAFDRLWHEGVFFKIQIYCLKGNILDFGFKSFFRQKAKCNVQKYTVFKCTQRVWLCPVTFLSCVNSKHVILNAILLMLHWCLLS